MLMVVVDGSRMHKERLSIFLLRFIPGTFDAEFIIKVFCLLLTNLATHLHEAACQTFAGRLRMEMDFRKTEQER